MGQTKYMGSVQIGTLVGLDEWGCRAVCDLMK